jgi:hypothetical protein
VIAAGRSAVFESTGFVDIYRNIEIYGFGHFQEKVREKRTRWPAAYHGDPGTFPQGELPFFVFY